jgi:hypothetical protein
MLASEIILRARHVADLPESQFIDHNDELASLNESWKDIYAALLENDDDYYLTETTLTLGPTVAVAGTTNEYLLPLPTDCSRIRYVDYRGTMDWLPMLKFNLSMKDNQPASPYYRIKGSFLWIIGASVPATGLSVKIGYYPVQATITAPMTPLSFGTSYLPNLFANVTAPGYAAYHKIMVYAYTGTFIRAESIDNSTVSAPVALFTDAAAVTNIVYYKGTLYWIRGGFIWYKVTDLTAAFVAPTQATTPAGVTSFSILNNLVYYTNAVQVRRCDLTGSAPSDTLIWDIAATSIAVLGISTVTVFATIGSNLWSMIPATLIATGISEVQSDGTYLYVRDTAYQLRKIAVSVSTTVTVTSDVIIATDVIDIGQPTWDVYETPPIYVIPVIKNLAQTLQGFDTSVDFDFSYPNNLIPEIMAYQSAIDYRAKQKQDTDELKEKLAAKWETFSSMIRRDDYLPTRMRNAYPGVR